MLDAEGREAYLDAAKSLRLSAEHLRDVYGDALAEDLEGLAELMEKAVIDAEKMEKAATDDLL